ncbi:hypothetical protein J5Y03_02645 [Bacillus sp. RG28]|uniref:Uncharacterized protein n=1 Tax=Gottfriedia endophytica TaxID=2820819 RepID=A0A940NM65_9BACI|nr:hypothetical protein [Gottfriedia endophytica]MBP0724080.1 hypothetical protein [Gottfriedia endophytica]
MKIKSEIKSITLQFESYQFPFPPVVTITTENEEIELENEIVKPKGLHYEYDAISADYNIDNANNIKFILETYQSIITEFNKYEWGKICKVSDNFEVKFIKP